MIQRIQTLFLLLAGGLSLALLGVPFSGTSETVAVSPIFADASYTIADSPVLLLFYLLGGALALIAIFLFQKRMLQMRLSIFSFIAILLGMVLTVILFIQDPVMDQAVQPDDRAGVYMPFVALVALLLALRFIRKDEEKVRSMDRLR